MALSASVAYAAAARAAQQPLPSQPPAQSISTSASSIGSSSSYGSKPGNAAGGDAHTPTALSRWSLLTHKLPAADAIHSIHVYDFDNTLFKTPLPSSKLWSASSIGYLSSQDVFSTGGWWHDSRILAATGAGLDAEEPRAWEGWWNEHIVDLVRLSTQEPGVLCILLTGRSERGFGDLIQRMVRSKGLTFDMITLKPAAGPSNERFAHTMAFKQAFLSTVLATYTPRAAAMRIYEDRPRHVEAFTAFLDEYSQKHAQQHQQHQQKPALEQQTSFTGEVIHVAQVATTLDPVIEVAEVQHMINLHNAALTKNGGGGGGGGSVRYAARPRYLAMHKTVFFTGYMVTEADTKRLLDLLKTTDGAAAAAMAATSRRDLKYHGNSIMISPRACPPHLLAKAGGMGSKMVWRVDAIGYLSGTSAGAGGANNGGVWAVRVRPAPSSPSATYHTAEGVPLVVLAVAHGARPHEAARIRAWQPLAANQIFDFETTVGEKAMLRIEVESQPAQPQNGGAQGRRPPPTGPHANNNKRRFLGSGQHAAPAAAAAAAAAGAGIPTQPFAFGVPRGPSSGGGRGHHYQSAAGRGGSGRGGGRGGGGPGTGGYRGGAAVRGGGRGGHGGPPHGPAAAAAQPSYRGGYQSLDDAGPQPFAATTTAQVIPPRQQIVYDDAL